MADITDRAPENADGEYYVDRTCVHCKLCTVIAPDHFTQEEWVGFVKLQPAGDQERALCEEARAGCPVNAIGNDGAPVVEEKAA